MLWTLDLNGKRYIVKSFPGQAQGGMRYLYWAGAGKEFAPKPLALSFISPPQPRAMSPTTRDSPPPVRPSFAPVNRKRIIPSDSPESSNSSDTSDSEVEGRSSHMPGLTQPVANAGPEEVLQQIDDGSSDHDEHRTGETNASKRPAAFQGGTAKKRKAEVSSREIGQLYRVSSPARPQSDGLPTREHHSGLAQPTTTTPTRQGNDREKLRKQRAIDKIETLLERKFAQIFTPWAGEDQGVSRNTLGMISRIIGHMRKNNSPQSIARSLNEAVNGGDGERQHSGGLKPTESNLKALETTLIASNGVTVNGGTRDTLSSPLGSNRQQLDQKSSPRVEAANVQGTGSNPRTLPLESNQHPRVQGPDSDSPTLTVLTAYKQKQTTLYVRVADSVEYLPLKMSECMTPEAFYTKVLSAWNIPGQSVAKITVTFTWMDPKDRTRTMIMNNRVQSCYEHLLGQIDEAPGWEEGGRGKCVVDVDILVKE